MRILTWAYDIDGSNSYCSQTPEPIRKGSPLIPYNNVLADIIY